MNILICDDDIMIIKSVEMRLKREGYEIITAMNGKTGVEIAGKTRIDLIITDLLMPLVNGIDLVYSVRKELQKDMPIIVLSSIGLENTVIKAFKYGADDYVIKPFSLNELAFRVKILLKRKYDIPITPIVKD